MMDRVLTIPIAARWREALSSRDARAEVRHPVTHVQHIYRNRTFDMLYTMMMMIR